jgi:hypothetical protein
MSPTLPPRRMPALTLAIVAGLVLGILAVTGVGLAAGTGRLAGQSDQSKALEVLRQDQAALARMARDVGSDADLADLQASADAARRLADEARDRDASLVVLDDEAVKGPALRAHRASVAILVAFSDLGDVSAEDLDAWDASEREAVAALGELDVVAAPVASLDDEQPVRLDTRQVDAVVEKASAYLTESARRLASYERRMVKFRRKNRRKLQAAEDYAATVRAQVASYQATRKDLQEYFDDTKSFGDWIVDFRDALQDAKSKRQGIRSTLASLTPPGALQGEQLTLVSVLDDAIAGTDVGVDLADATQRLRDTGDYETSGFELPEYDEFVNRSEQITAKLGSGMSAWTTSMDTLIRRIKHPRTAPKRPSI